jgi:two-component system nitrogen regulation sensor histidine kinase GlnL
MNAELPRPGLPPARRHIEHDLLLATLPHPILVLGDNERVLYANAAAESFFSLGQGLLKRQMLPDIIAFSSPLAALVAQVRTTGHTVNEYGLEVHLPRFGPLKLEDVFAGPMPDQPA